MTTQQIVLIAVAIVLVAAIVTAILVIRSRRRSEESPSTPGAPREVTTEVAPTPGSSGAGTTAAPAIQVPESVDSRLVRLRGRLARSGALGQALLAVLGRDTLDEEAWEELEETLLQADLGLAPTTELLEELRTRLRVEGSRDPQRVRAILRELLLAQVDPTMDRSLSLDPRPLAGGRASDAGEAGEAGEAMVNVPATS